MNISSTYEAVVFDFDGVLVVGSNEAYFPVYHAAFESVGHHMPADEERALILHYWSWPSSHFFRHLFAGDEARADRATEVYRRSLFTRVFLDALRVNPALGPMLARIRARGVQLGIVSGANGELLRRVLGHHGLADHFGAVLSGYDFAPEHQKPSPHMLLEACRQLRCAAGKSLYVGDTDSDLEAARRAGMHACAVLTGNLNRSQAEEHRADWIVQTAVDVEGVLDGHRAEGIA